MDLMESVGLAEAALGEGTGAKLHKLSVKDIKYVREETCVCTFCSRP
jgi:hypothetical protein